MSRRQVPRAIRALALLICLWGCHSDQSTEPQLKFKITPDSPNLIIGSTIRLTLDSSSGSESSGDATWSTSAPAIVRVDATGRITGMAVGTATIRALTDNGAAETVVTVVGSTSSLTTRVTTTCGIVTSGELYCWGLNDFGQTGGGDQTSTPILAPRKVEGNLTFSTVSTSTTNTCGITSSGTYCWGDNALGQIGDGTRGNVRLIPTKVSGTNSFTRVVPATTVIRTGISDCTDAFLCTARTCALATDGAVWCWGESTNVPARVPLTVQLDAFDAAFQLACGLDRASLPYCWGTPRFLESQLLINGAEPAKVPDAPPFQAISTGHGHACGLDFNGDVYCWGANGAGELGSPSGATTCGTSRDSPPVACRAQAVRVASDQKFLSVTVGDGSSVRLLPPDAQTCALATTLQIFCWGSNANGQLGIGSTTSTSVPTLVSGSLRFRSVTAGRGHTCGVTVDNDAYCWGAGASLGRGVNESSSVPVKVSGGLKFK